MSSNGSHSNSVKLEFWLWGEKYNTKTKNLIYIKKFQSLNKSLRFKGECK